MRKVIFDLDQTLVDTTSLEGLRRARKWNDVYSLIPQTVLYDGMRDVLDVLEKHAIPVVIVSTSPRAYIERVVKHHNIPVKAIIGYHDVVDIKPAPEAMLKALECLGCSPKDAISFGDRAIDIKASNAAGIESVACFWGTQEKRELLHSGYTHAIVSPMEILTLIR